MNISVVVNLIRGNRILVTFQSIWSCFLPWVPCLDVLAHCGAWVSDSGGWTKASTQNQTYCSAFNFDHYIFAPFSKRIRMHACMQPPTLSKTGKINITLYCVQCSPQAMMENIIWAEPVATSNLKSSSISPFTTSKTNLYRRLAGSVLSRILQ